MVFEPLTGQSLNLAPEYFSHLAGLDFADSSFVEVSLDIGTLIGTDHCWLLVTGKICQEETGSSVIETKLGWVLSSPVPGVYVKWKYYSQLCIYSRSDGWVRFKQCMWSRQNTESMWDLETVGIKDDKSFVWEDFIRTFNFKTEGIVSFRGQNKHPL